MKDFFQLLMRFVPPYRKYLFLNILFNFLAAFLTLFSFALIIPILEMLFKVKEASYEFMPLGSASLKDVAINNFYWLTQECIVNWGPVGTLVLLSVMLVIMTALKTGATYASLYYVIPMRAGIVRDIRNFVYDKIVSLPIAYFTSERKGDVMARISVRAFRRLVRAVFIALFIQINSLAVKPFIERTAVIEHSVYNHLHSAGMNFLNKLGKVRVARLQIFAGGNALNVFGRETVVLFPVLHAVVNVLFYDR